MRTLLTLAALTLLGAPALAADPTIEELLDATDDVGRGQSSVTTMQMHVKTDRYERTVTMKAWTQGEEQSLIVIQDPPKEKGVATLKVDDNIWNYLPKVDRTVKVPANMMSGSWMGSHITNDDLVKENRLADEFTAEITERPEGDAGHWTIELVPKPDAPVVWGKVVVQVRPDKIPLQVQYYDEKGALVRTMSFEDVKEMDGELMPTRMKFVPADKPGEYTEITYQEVDFDVEIPKSTFTLQALKQ